jgi:hypothetical protein
LRHETIPVVDTGGTDRSSRSEPIAVHGAVVIAWSSVVLYEAFDELPRSLVGGILFQQKILKTFSSGSKSGFP